MEKKAIENHICGANGCTRPANKKLIFPLGFSAKFCLQCADDLVEQKVAIQEAAKVCLTFIGFIRNI